MRLGILGTGKIVRELMKEYARTTQLLFLGVGFLTGGFVYAIGRPFIGLYGGISAEAAAVALSFARVLAVTSVGTCYQMPCLFGLVKSGGDISFVFKNDSFFVFCVVLPSAFLAAHLGAPAWVTFACLKSDQILKCFVAMVKVNRYRWIRKLTREGFFEENDIHNVFVFGGTNDSWCGASLGQPMESGWEETDLYCVLPAISCYLQELKQTLPEAKIYCLINNNLQPEIEDALKAACGRQGIKSILFDQIDKENDHPTAQGMRDIKDQVLAAIAGK